MDDILSQLRSLKFPLPTKYTGNESMLEFYEHAKEARLNQKYIESAFWSQKMLSLDPSNSYFSDALYELSISLYYIDKKQLGSQLTDLIKLSKQIKARTKTSTHLNSIYYINIIPYLSYYAIDLKLSESNVYPLNPSLLFLANKNSYLVNCRSVNYLLTESGSRIFHPNNITITRNFLLLMNKDFTIINNQEIIDKESRVFFEKHCQGYEDIRLFEWSVNGFNGSFWFTATTWDTHLENIAKITLCHLNENKIDYIKVLNGPDSKKHEKNWLPLVINQQLHIIYSFSPLIILKVNHKTGETTKIFEKEFDKDYSYFRGGTTAIKMKLEKDGYFCFIHEVVDLSHRYYLTRGVWLSSDFTDIKITLPFYFIERGIEFASGLAQTNNDELVVGVGVNDRKAFLFRIAVKTIKEMLGGK